MENRTPEFVVSLIGVILGTVGWVPLVIITIASGFVPSDQMPASLVVFLLIYSIIDVPLIVFNWIGTFKLKYKAHNWGIYFLVTGIIFLNIWSIITGGMLLGRHPGVVNTPTNNVTQ